MRRIGALNAEDRSHGLYALHDKVQVTVEGRWENGEIVMKMGEEYQVQLSGNRTTWAAPQYLHFVSGGDKPASPAAKSGTSQRAGATSCAGKLEGRYATQGASES